MKNIRVYLLSLLVLVLGSCSESYLDVNNDPNSSLEAQPGPIFTQVIVGYSTNRVIDIGPSVSTAAQLWSGGGSLGAGVFTNPEQYNFSIFATGNTWRTYYRDSYKDLILAANGAREAGQTNSVVQCDIFRALVLYSATVLWEDVPFSEAVNVDFDAPAIVSLNPNFDDQSEVLQGVIDILDGAVALIDDSPTSFTSQDLIYGGNMESWRRFAKSLKFRTLMTLVDAEPARSTEIAAMMAENDMINASSLNAVFPFFPTPGNRNPFWETLNSFASARNLFYFAGEAMVNLMASRNDPRISTYFQPYPFGGSAASATGAPPGLQNFPTNPWVLSTAPVGTNGEFELVRPDAGDVLFSYQEQLFLEAEAIARGLASGDLSAADSKLRDGITTAMNQNGISQDAITAYLDSEIPPLASLSQEEARVVIAEQEWIDCIIRPLEGWTTWRRTEVPALSLPDGAATTSILRRLPYPPDELAANTNAPADPDLDEPMYFDK
ncbi:MAG: SusD/RagB family nutrient-binding outer membrane lipoprotein [Bacteroidota bacterium]